MDDLFLDARELSMMQKFQRVLDAVNSLEPGQTLILINEVDPKPLKLKLGRNYSMEYVESRHSYYKVRVTRL